MTAVLAVIPCLNEKAHLPGLLDQLLADPIIDLIVVADGGSTDGSRELVETRLAGEPRLRLMHNTARIQSAGVNCAVRQFGDDYDWLLRVDAHCLYPDLYASTLLAAAAESGAQSVVVPMVTRSNGGFQTAAATAQNSVIGTGGSPHRHLKNGQFVNHGHHALMDINRFRAVGGYCEAMPCNEDAELDHRLVAAGALIWLDPRAAIDYFPRRDPIALARQYFRYGVGRARNIRRHSLRPAMRQLIPLLVPAAALLAILAFWHPVFALPLMIWSIATIVAGVFIGLRAKSGWAMLSGVAAAIMHFGWGCGFLREWFRLSPPPDPAFGFVVHNADKDEQAVSRPKI